MFYVSDTVILGKKNLTEKFQFFYFFLEDAISFIFVSVIIMVVWKFILGTKRV